MMVNITQVVTGQFLTIHINKAIVHNSTVYLYELRFPKLRLKDSKGLVGYIGVAVYFTAGSRINCFDKIFNENGFIT